MKSKNKISVTHDRINCKHTLKSGEAVRFALSRNGAVFQFYPTEETPTSFPFDASIRIDLAKALNKLGTLLLRRYDFLEGENNLNRVERFNAEMSKFSTLEQLYLYEVIGELHNEPQNFLH